MVYYAAGVVVGIVLLLLDVYVFEWGIDWENNTAINFLGLPAGLLAVWGFYALLESRWKHTVVVVQDEIQDIGKNIEG